MLLEAPRGILEELRAWQARRWWVAAATAAITIVIVAIPTVLIPNPWFAREISVTPWAWQVLLVSGILAGLVAATYVARKDIDGTSRGGALGTTGAIISFFAVGCPVCNKLVLIAIGYTGALQFFEPLQPYLAGGSIVLLFVALIMRIQRERSCALPGPAVTHHAAAKIDLETTHI